MNNPFTDRLRPSPTLDSQPYWDGLMERRLLLQQCADCGTVRHYPRPVCDQCYSMNVEWIEASGDATIHSWTISHHAFHPCFKKDLPLTLVTADLAEGVRLCARLRNVPPESLSFGAAVRVTFEAVEDDLVLPVLVLGDTS
jgi:uncharacterized OB-fold protein